MALILTRKVGESIMIGDDIEIFLSEINGKEIKFSILADKKIPIYRKEIRDKMILEAKKSKVKPEIYIRRKIQEAS